MHSAPKIRHAFLLASLLTLGGFGCSSGAGVESGELSVMTYNVAGLPQGLSGSNPVENTWQIGAKLEAFELV